MKFDLLLTADLEFNSELASVIQCASSGGFPKQGDVFPFDPEEAHELFCGLDVKSPFPGDFSNCSTVVRSQDGLRLKLITRSILEDRDLINRFLHWLVDWLIVDTKFQKPGQSRIVCFGWVRGEGWERPEILTASYWVDSLGDRRISLNTKLRKPNRLDEVLHPVKSPFSRLLCPQGETLPLP